MSKHTDGAVRAAAKRIVQLFYLIKQEKAGRTVHDALLRTSRYELERDVEAIIDQETGLLEITAERDKLREACKWCEAELEYLLALKTTLVRPSGIHALDLVRAALAKEPESGIDDSQVNRH